MPHSTKSKWYLKHKLTLLLATGVVFLGLYVIWHTDKAPRTDDAYAYADSINVSSEVSGRIIDLSVKDNQHVRKGDLLMQIDPRPFQNALDKANANLDTLNHEIELTQRTVNAQIANADVAKANIERARAVYEQASDTLNRMEPLKNTQYISQEQVDQARTAKQTAMSALNMAILEAKRAQSAISSVDALVAKKEIIKAEIAQAKLNLEYTTIKAPFDGIVVGLKTSVGQFTTTGHSIFTLINTTKWYVIANFRETEIGTITPGETTQVYILSNPSKRFQGKIESIGFGVYPDDGGSSVDGLPHVVRTINWVRVAQRFPIRIAIDNPDDSLFRIGASAVAILSPEKN